MPELTDQGSQLLMEKFGGKINEIINRLKSEWTNEKDNELVNYINSYYQKSGRFSVDIPLKEFSIESAQLSSYPLLKVSCPGVTSKYVTENRKPIWM